MAQSMIELRKAIYARLTTAISGTPVYSYVPPESNMPYIVIGEISATDAGTKTMDTLDYEVTIHAFDKGEGSSVTIDGLVKEIYDALQWYDLSITGYTAIKCHLDVFNIMQQGEIADYYWHGVLRFTVTVQDAL